MSGSPTVVIVVVRTVVSSRCEAAALLIASSYPIPSDPALPIGCVKGGEATPSDDAARAAVDHLSGALGL